jgi:hypothetical protein
MCPSTACARHVATVSTAGIRPATSLHRRIVQVGCDREISAWASVVTGFVALLVAAASGLLYFDNLYGPLGEYPRFGALAGLGCGSLAGATVFTFTWWVARRSRVLLIVLVGAVCASGWVLLPRQVDVSESWVPRSNPRWACTGWSFRHYPPRTSDAADTTYCVGLEDMLRVGLMSTGRRLCCRGLAQKMPAKGYA